MARGASWLAIGLFFATPTFAQQLRGEVFGTVRVRGDDTAHDDWAGAKVVLVSHAFPFDSRIGVTDRVECTIDARGRFRASLLLGRNYSAWAWHDAADGARCFTKIVTSVRAGMSIGLQPETEARAAIAMMVVGVEPWCAGGALRCIVTTPDDDLDREEVAIDRDGIVTMPPLPGERTEVRVEQADGLPIARHVWTKAELRDPAQRSLDLAPPHDHPLKLTDARSGAPLRGARLYRLPTGPAFAFATTDVDGNASVTLPRPSFVRRGFALFGDTLVAQRPGYAPALAHGDSADGIWARLFPSEGLTGRVVRGTRPASCEVTAVLFERVDDQLRTNQHAYICSSTTTDAAGRFSFASWTGDARQSRLGLLLRPPEIDPDCDALVVDPIDLLHTTLSGADVGDIDLDALLDVELEVLEPDGTPASSALCRRGIGRAFGDFHAVETRADMRGRLRLLLHDADVPIHLSTESGSALLCSIPTGGSERGRRKVTVSLHRRRRIEGHVLSMLGHAMRSHLYEVGQVIPATGAVGAGEHAADVLLSLGMVPATQFTTDSEGHFDVEVEFLGSEVQIRAPFFVGSNSARRDQNRLPPPILTLTAASPALDLQIVDPRGRQ